MIGSPKESVAYPDAWTASAHHHKSGGTFDHNRSPETELREHDEMAHIHDHEAPIG